MEQSQGKQGAPGCTGRRVRAALAVPVTAESEVKISLPSPNQLQSLMEPSQQGPVLTWDQDTVNRPQEAEGDPEPSRKGLGKRADA